MVQGVLADKIRVNSGPLLPHLVLGDPFIFFFLLTFYLFVGLAN